MQSKLKIALAALSGVVVASTVYRLLESENEETDDDADGPEVARPAELRESSSS